MASRKHSTPVTIPATKVGRNFGEVIQRINSGEEHVVVEEDGLPVVAIISVAEYQAFLRAREEAEPTKDEILHDLRQAMIEARTGNTHPAREALAELRQEIGEYADEG